jgi:hypothetical protein
MPRKNLKKGGDANSSTHVNNQITALNVGTPDHRVREIGLDGNGISEAKEMPLLGEIVDIYLSPDDDLRRYYVDAYLNVEIAHLGSDERVVLGHGPAHLPSPTPEQKRK